MDRVFVELRMALPMAVDVFPGLRVIEGKLGGHQAYDRAVFIVQFLHFEGPAAAVKTPNGQGGGDFAD